MIIKNGISVADYQTLHKAVGWKILSDSIVRKSLKNSHIVLSAYENNKTVGMVRLVSDRATHGHLTDVIVLPEYQGRGIGKSLILELSNRIQTFVNNKDQFLLELVPSKGYEEFYKKCGFNIDNSALLGAYRWFKNQNIYKENK